MSAPKTVDDILRMYGYYITGGLEKDNQLTEAEAKAQIEAMIADILGKSKGAGAYHDGDLSNPATAKQVAINIENGILSEQYARATKYNLTLKEGK